MLVSVGYNYFVSLQSMDNPDLNPDDGDMVTKRHFERILFWSPEVQLIDDPLIVCVYSVNDLAETRLKSDLHIVKK